MTAIDIIMTRAHALLPASASPGPEAYDNAMQALENEVRRAMEKPATEPTDPYVGLPITAVNEGCTMVPFNVPDDVEPIHPDMIQMMDDMAQWWVK